NRPVHWITTTGRAPPSNRPAATPMASPSRHGRISFSLVEEARAASHGPRALSGIQTTCVNPVASRFRTAVAGSSMTNSAYGTNKPGPRPGFVVFRSAFRLPRFASWPVVLVAGLARLLEPAEHLLDLIRVFLGGRVGQGLGIHRVLVGQLLPAR